LLAAEIQIAKLDKAKADGVTAMIKSIHNPVRLSDQQAVKDARAAYDTLSSDQKKLVSNLKKLIQAEERIQKLLEKEKRN
ncbi:MAG: hypothetical protein N2484_08285, partial [Clostridia bacterium]|nr:hypothetical protein [Clostridia bacterium]